MQTQQEQNMVWTVTQDQVNADFLERAESRGVKVTIAPVIQSQPKTPSADQPIGEAPTKKGWTIPGGWKRWAAWGLAFDAIVTIIVIVGTLLSGPKPNNMGRGNPNYRVSAPITIQRPPVADNMGVNNPNRKQGQQVAIVLPAPTMVAQVNPIPQPAGVIIPATVGQTGGDQPRMALSVAQQIGANGGAPVDNMVIYQEPQVQQAWGGGQQRQQQQWNGGYQQPQRQQPQTWNGGYQQPQGQQWNGNPGQRCFGCAVEYQPQRGLWGYGAYQARANIDTTNPQLTYQQLQPAGVQPRYQHYAPIQVGPFTIQPPPRLQTVVGGVYRVGSPLSCPGALGLLGGIFGTCSGGGLVQLQPNGQYLPVR